MSILKKVFLVSTVSFMAIGVTIARADSPDVLRAKAAWENSAYLDMGDADDLLQEMQKCLANSRRGNNYNHCVLPHQQAFMDAIRNETGHESYQFPQLAGVRDMLTASCKKSLSSDCLMAGVTNARQLILKIQQEIGFNWIRLSSETFADPQRLADKRRSLSRPPTTCSTAGLRNVREGHGEWDYSMRSYSEGGSPEQRDDERPVSSVDSMILPPQPQ